MPILSRTPKKSNLLAIGTTLFGGFILFACVLIYDGWIAFGHSPSVQKLQKAAVNSTFHEGQFQNPESLYNDYASMLVNSLSPGKYPEPVGPVTTQAGPDFTVKPKSGLRVTWLGHSTVIIEMDGYTILTDPVWGSRSSPFSWLGPKRWYAPPISLADLPKIDAVLISHDHYDHLDYPSILALKQRGMQFIVPLGVGAHLRYWGVSDEHIRELDWWQSVKIGELELVCTPARHASGRQVFDQDRTLWAGYALLGPKHRVFFSGDTGLFTGMKEIGRRLGPFDVTMIEVGAYDEAWPDWHIGPEQAVLAHQWVRGQALLPIHWGLFDLALHNWTEPMERSLAAAKKSNVSILTPRPGQAIEPKLDKTDIWWPKIPWETAVEHPIISTKVRRN
jgi:L-ascorbate metabolism protein UlaG (beta-lactamase superfamily)